MKAQYLNDMPVIHSTPLQKVYFDEDNSFIEFDDESEIRWIVRFKTIHAWRSTNINYFDIVNVLNNLILSDGTIKRYPIILDDSQWIKDLKIIQEIKNPTSQSLNNSKHILFMLGDDIVEVIVNENYETTKV